MSDRLTILLVIIAAAVVLSAVANALLRRRSQIVRIDPADLAPSSQVIVFTSPYCHGCRQWLDALAEDNVTTQAIDIAKRPDAAARYRINSTPRIAVVDVKGIVLREFDHYAPRRSDLDVIGRLVAAA